MIAYAREPRCAACGREISDTDARFCAGCGSALGEDSTPPSPVILSAVDELDPQDAPTRFGLERASAGRSTIAPGASVRAVGHTTRTRRSRRVGRPTAATRGDDRPSSYAAPRPMAPERNELDLDLAASRRPEGPTPVAEPFPTRTAHFDGDPFFEDVFRDEASEPRLSTSAAELDEPDIAGIQRARRARAVVGVVVTLAAVGVAVSLAVV